MIPLTCVLLGCLVLGQGEAEKPKPVRYLKPEGNRFVLESEVTDTTTSTGSTYVSRTVRGRETLTLTVHRDKDGTVVGAEIVHRKGEVRKTASVDLRTEPAKIKRGGVTDFVKVPANPVVTTAPDWSDVFELVRRYDAKKGGKQEFPGLWFHPSQPYLMPTFTIERSGADGVKVKDETQELTRYRIGLRSGGYRVWARADGRVCKILPEGERAVPVVLEGYEEATRGLK
ncbi:MAG: hypothetical protein HYS12_11795 [Planctomycetes bacterium]|nr:hypothetical protein [Planctomycetota bacterium]